MNKCIAILLLSFLPIILSAQKDFPHEESISSSFRLMAGMPAGGVQLVSESNLVSYSASCLAGMNGYVYLEVKAGWNIVSKKGYRLFLYPLYYNGVFLEDGLSHNVPTGLSIMKTFNIMTINTGLDFYKKKNSEGDKQLGCSLNLSISCLISGSRYSKSKTNS